VSRLGNTHTKVEVQPSNSPDVNGNDLGFFPSMSARVSRFEAVEPRNVPTLFKNVLRCYTEYDAETLERVWLSKSRVMQCIIDDKGNNYYQPPHRRDV